MRPLSGVPLLMTVPPHAASVTIAITAKTDEVMASLQQPLPIEVVVAFCTIGDTLALIGGKCVKAVDALGHARAHEICGICADTSAQVLQAQCMAKLVRYGAFMSEVCDEHPRLTRNVPAKDRSASAVLRLADLAHEHDFDCIGKISGRGF
jgi:hypothetical protein